MPSRVFAAAVAALFAVAAGPVISQNGPAGVLTERVLKREVTETVPVFAQIVAVSDSDLAVRISGVVTNVSVETGSRVEAGQAIAEIDREVLEITLSSAEAALAEARAGVDVAEADLVTAERAFERVEGLRDTSAFSQGRLEDAEGALLSARGERARADARVLAAEAALAEARYNLARATVTAPFAATVLEVLIDPGEYVQTGAAVARLLEVDTMEVEANVPAQFVGSLEEGMVLSGESDVGTPLELTVRAVLPTEFTTTRTRPVRFTTDLQAGFGRPAVGQSLTVDVPRAATRSAVLVPKDALSQSRGAWMAFVNENGSASPRTVEIGASFGRFFEVLGGLAPGDEVVVRGNERLRPNQPIAPQPAPSGDPDATAGDGVPAQGREDGADDTAAGERRQAAVDETR